MTNSSRRMDQARIIATDRARRVARGEWGPEFTQMERTVDELVGFREWDAGAGRYAFHWPVEIMSAWSGSVAQ